MRQLFVIGLLALILWLFTPSTTHAAAAAGSAAKSANATPAMTTAGAPAEKLVKPGDEVKPPKEDKPKKSKKNPNDGKDGDPDDGNAGGGNDGKKLPNDGPQND